MGDPFSDLIDEAGDLASSALDEAEATAKAALEAAENAIKTIVDTVESGYEWTADQIEAAIDELADLEQSLEQVIGDAATAVAGIAKDFAALVKDGVDALADGWRAFVDAVGDAADWVLGALSDIADFVLDRLLPLAWGALKLAVVGYLLVAGGLALVFGGLLWWLLPAAVLTILICTANKRDWGEGYGNVLRDIVAGTPQMEAGYRIARLPAQGRYFITSDHHRYSPSATLDSFTSQGNAELYRGMLEYYAFHDYSLIENGDMEDFWLRGGSAKGVVNDIAAMMPSPIADVIYSDGADHAAARNHLKNTVVGNASNLKIYQTVKSLFHDRGRLYRVAGNHDGAYQFDDVVDVLRLVYPGIAMKDVIVLTGNGGSPTGVVTHGHKTDAWSADSCSFIGETFVSLSSALRDFSMGLLQPGVPSPEDTLALWNSAPDAAKPHKNELKGPPAFNQTLGASFDSDFSTMNETAVFDAVRNAYGGNGWPAILFGHTHGPLVDPADPRSAAHESWFDYFNDGSGLFYGMITGLEWEWDGHSDNPDIRLVGWRYEGASQIRMKRFLSFDRWWEINAGQKVLQAIDGVTFTPTFWRN